MWYFIAYYDNMDNNETITRNIKIEEQFFKNEKEIYMFAMSTALNKMQPNESLVSVEFLAC